MRRRSLAVLAVLVIGAGFWLVADGEQRTVSRAPTVSPPGSATYPPEVLTPSTVAKPPRAIPDGYRIQVPRLRIDLPIREGDVTRDVVNEQTPEHAAFHFPGTALPGEGSNTYVYAHARTGMFLSLWNAREGDEVILIAPDGTQLRYVVSEVHPRILPTDTRWLWPTSSERLTLQTSTGPHSDDPAFVVVAVPRTT